MNKYLIFPDVNCDLSAEMREYFGLQDYIKATDIILTREEWYDIYRAAGNILP